MHDVADQCNRPGPDSYASFLVDAGRSLYEVQKLLGHHDPKVTMRYAHLSPQAIWMRSMWWGRSWGGGR
jgi:integrase